MVTRGSSKGSVRIFIRETSFLVFGTSAISRNLGHYLFPFSIGAGYTVLVAGRNVFCDLRHKHGASVQSVQELSAFFLAAYHSSFSVHFYRLGRLRSLSVLHPGHLGLKVVFALFPVFHSESNPSVF